VALLGSKRGAELAPKVLVPELFAEACEHLPELADILG
jgi:hypothetical protein